MGGIHDRKVWVQSHHVTLMSHVTDLLLSNLLIMQLINVSGHIHQERETLFCFRQGVTMYLYKQQIDNRNCWKVHFILVEPWKCGHLHSVARSHT